MKQTLGRFLSQENRDFPADCETFDNLQTNIAMVAILGNIAGDKAILQGCEYANNNTRREPGYVFVRTRDYPNGEVLYWDGGSISGGMYIRQEVLGVSDRGNVYPQAYVIRSLAPGLGVENYSWTDFREVKTSHQLDDYNKEQDKAIQQLAPPPFGIVQMWAGNTVPQEYELCDGKALKIEEYRELYSAIGVSFNNASDYNGNAASTATGYFRLPDLRGRFVVGRNEADADYKNNGKVGGSKKHALTINEMPNHNHSMFLVNWGTRFTGSGAADELNSGSGFTGSAGGGQAHENRPPYYTLAYIMRVK